MKKEKFKIRLHRSRLVSLVHMLCWYHRWIPVWDCFNSYDDEDICIFIFEVDSKDMDQVRHFIDSWGAS